jgi:hypothetical protein
MQKNWIQTLWLSRMKQAMISRARHLQGIDMTFCSERNPCLAKDIAQDVTINRLTRVDLIMIDRFKALGNDPQSPFANCLGIA